MQLIPDLYQLDCTKNSRAYAVRCEDGITLIDTSSPGRGDRILQELKGYGIEPEQIRRILLTHCDADHIGNVAYLQDKTGCEVYIGRPDLPYALGELNQPGFKGILNRLSGAKCPTGTKILPQGEWGEFTVLPTPGHTPGHTCFRWRNVLFMGDLVFSSRDRLRMTPSIFIQNRAENEASIRSLPVNGVEWLCVAHSKPVRLEPAWSQLREETHLG